MKRYVNIISSGLVALSAASFLLLYLVLSFFNRPASDDILFISILKGKSISEYIKWFYETWSGRWTGTAYFYQVMSVSNAFQNIHYYMFIYYLITIIVFIYSIAVILNFSINKLFNIELSFKTIVVYSILFIGAFYFLTFQYMEVWWWMCASVDTLQGIVFLLLGVALLINEKKTIVHYLFIAFCFIYIGGGYEIYSLLIISTSLIILCYFIMKRSKQFFSFSTNRFLKSLLTALFALLLSFSISILSPGNMKRRTYLFKENKTENSVLTTREVGALINSTVFTQKKFVAGIGFAALWLLLGFKLKSKTDVLKAKRKMKYLLRLSALLVIVSIGITLAFQYIILGNSFIPPRGWTFTSFAITVFLCLLFLYLGCYANISSSITQPFIKIVLPSIMMFVLLFTIFKQYNYVSKYASEYDTLIAELIEKQKSGNTKTVYVNNLPDPGMLIPIDISDSSITVLIREILHLKYNIAVK